MCSAQSKILYFFFFTFFPISLPVALFSWKKKTKWKNLFLITLYRQFGVRTSSSVRIVKTRFETRKNRDGSGRLHDFCRPDLFSSSTNSNARSDIFISRHLGLFGCHSDDEDSEKSGRETGCGRPRRIYRKRNRILFNVGIERRFYRRALTAPAVALTLCALAPGSKL